jgi:hypothetical protein
MIAVVGVGLAEIDDPGVGQSCHRFGKGGEVGGGTSRRKLFEFDADAMLRGAYALVEVDPAVKGEKGVFAVVAKTAEHGTIFIVGSDVEQHRDMVG